MGDLAPWFHYYDDILPRRREVLSRDTEGNVTGVVFRESTLTRAHRRKVAAEWYDGQIKWPPDVVDDLCRRRALALRDAMRNG